MGSLVRDRRRKTFWLAGFFAAVAIALLLTAADAESPLAQEGAQISAAALSSVGSSGGKAVTVGFGADEIGDSTKRASFMSKAFTAVGRKSEQVALVDDDLSDRSDLGYQDVGPDLSAAIQYATGSAPEMIDVPYGKDGPSLSQLSGKTVVWATGEAWFSEDGSITKTTLTDADQTTLTDFLNGGGKLILTGKDALYLIESSLLVTSTLKLNVESDVGSWAYAKTFEGSSGTAFDKESYTFDSPTAYDPWHDKVEPAEGSAAAIQGVYPDAPDDTTAPTVGSVSPADAATDIEPSTDVVATFSEAMDSSTLSASTFTLTPQDSTTPVNATVSSDEATMSAKLDPSVDLAWNTTYTATIKGGSTGVEDLAGNPLAEDKVWSFTTAGPPPPNDNFADAQTISDGSSSIEGTTKGATRESGEPDHYTTNPADAGWWIGDHSVWYRWTAPETGKVTFDTCDSGTVLDSVLAVYTGSSLSNLTRVTDNNNDYCGGDWGAKVSFAAVADTTYYIAVSDVGGLRENTFNLTITVDNTTPKVISTTPTSNATGVGRGTNLAATFSEAVDPSTVTTSTFTLVRAGSTNPISATVGLSADGKTATLNPYGSATTYLAKCKRYKATVTTGVKDKAGNALDQDSATTGNQHKVWYFKTRGC